MIAGAGGRARARATALAVVATVAAAVPARAAPTRPAIAGVAADPADARAAILVGPAGQVYGPVPDAGGWTRTSAGGIATAIVAAAASGGDIFAAGASTPIYRWHEGGWTATPLPAKGAIVLGGGPAPAVAIGAAVFVRGAKGWARAGEAPSAPSSLYAASETQVWLVAGGVAWRLRGKAFVRAGAATAIAAGGAPLAIGAGQVIDLAAGRTIKTRTAGAVVAAARAGDVVAILVHGAAGWSVERHGARTTDTAPAPGAAAWTWMWADPRGRIAIAAPTGEVAILDGGSWRDAPVDTALPAPRAGPGPARSQ